MSWSTNIKINLILSTEPMGRRILLSFLGKGPMDSKETRVYKTAEYHLGQENLGHFPFVAAALKKHYQFDGVLLVGTVHSMWEEVYRWYAADRGMDIDDEVYFRIATECEHADHSSPLALTDITAIEQVLGGASKAVLIRYGMDEDEVRENINIVLGLQQYLQNGDELIVDITHSFRSLPIFIMNLLVYLQNVSRKQIKISHIHYGMLDVLGELGFAPIIDLKSMMEVSDWITGAYAFSEFGNAYKIAGLMDDEDKNVGNMLREFSELMNLNHLHGIQSLSQRLSSIKNTRYETLLPELTVTPIVNDFIQRFKVPADRHALFQLKVARWQLDHRKYAQALLTCNEAIITHVCEQNKLVWDDFDCRELAKDVLRWEPKRPESAEIICSEELKIIYNRMKRKRNSTAHQLMTEDNAASIIRMLHRSVNKLEGIIK